MWVVLAIACALASLETAKQGMLFVAGVFLVLAVMFLMASADSDLWRK